MRFEYVSRNVQVRFPASSQQKVMAAVQYDGPSHRGAVVHWTVELVQPVIGGDGTFRAGLRKRGPNLFAAMMVGSCQTGVAGARAVMGWSVVLDLEPGDVLELVAFMTVVVDYELVENGLRVVVE